MRTALPLLMVLAVSSGAPAGAQSAAKKSRQLDRTGMNWVVPFERARKQAHQTGRLLLIKPVAFGTDSSGGW